MIPRLVRTLKHEIRAKHSLANNLLYAAQTLGLELDDNLCISFEGSKPLSLQKVHPKDVRKALQQITRQACYSATPANARKDFFKPKGVFDVSQSLRFLRNRSTEGHLATLDASRFESVSVGCVLTNDRLASTGWVESSDCRFCHVSKESLPNLLQCDKLHEQIGRPIPHEFGPNFLTMGHVHHPLFVARRRLLHLTANELEVSPQFCDGEPRRLWSDGSVVHADRFWLATATYAIVDSNGQLVKKGQVNHWNLAAYSAELWAVIVACTDATRPIQLFSECLAVVEQASTVFAGGPIHAGWACKEWWTFLHRLVELRRQVCEIPFSVKWIPAHCFDDLPEYMITDSLAFSANTTREHILNNRAADRFAKSLAHKLAPVHPDMQRCADKAIEQHHSWLVALHTLLPTSDPAKAADTQAPSSSQEITIDQCRNRFPAWRWNLPKRHFPWRAKIPNKLAQPLRCSYTAVDWRTLCS